MNGWIQALERLQARYGAAPNEHREPLEQLLHVIVEPRPARSGELTVIEQLRESGLLSVRALGRLSVAELAEHLAGVGHAERKAKQLRGVLQLIAHQYGGSLDAWLNSSPSVLREQLLAVKGISPTLADTILLEVVQQPQYPVEIAALRVFARHGWVDFTADYESIQDFVHASFERDVDVYRALHTNVQRVASEFCKVAQPQCEQCPLACLLPSSGPYEML